MMFNLRLSCLSQSNLQFKDTINNHDISVIHQERQNACFKSIQSLNDKYYMNDIKTSHRHLKITHTMYLSFTSW